MVNTILKFDTWICPKCLVVHDGLDGHLQHLGELGPCITATLKTARVAGACRCLGLSYCTCNYRLRVRHEAKEKAAQVGGPLRS
jgi:hypothetical protein